MIHSKKWLRITAGILLSFSLLAGTKISAYAKTPIIVIDPGHGGTGGTNEGAQYNGFQEKSLTLVIAATMYQELSQYDGITVYLTRTEDKEMSLKERADFAKAVGADFVYSIHLNASTEHNFFGSEVWTSAYGKEYVRGASFGMIESDELAQLGIYSKGVKTKLGNKGNYYGIIRNCSENGIPSVIIEHCYMDQPQDAGFFNTGEKLAALGKADATAVAKFYGLKSTALGKDYSGYIKPEIKLPKAPVAQDTTAPEICQLTQLSYAENTGTAIMNLQATDSNGCVIYYDYSTDGGVTFSPLYRFQPALDSGTFSVSLKGGNKNVICRAYNQYDGVTLSNAILVQ